MIPPFDLPKTLRPVLASLQALALDVDGVLTDGRFWWGTNGQEYKQFSFADVMGVSLGRKAGLRFALISGENSPFVDRFAQKMSIEDVYKGTKEKATCLREFARKHTLDLAHVGFMGDDVNDLPALALAGLAVAPSNANPAVKAQVHWVTQRAGGNGAVREVVDAILACKLVRTDDPFAPLEVRSAQDIELLKLIRGEVSR